MSMSMFPSLSERKYLLPISFCPKASMRLRWLLNDLSIAVSSSYSGWQEGAILFPMENSAMSEDIRVVIGGCYWNLVHGARDAAKYPVMHRAAPHHKGLSGLKCQ